MNMCIEHVWVMYVYPVLAHDSLMVSWSHGELSGRPEVHLLEVREILLEALAGQNDVSRTTEQPWRAERKSSLQSERKHILR